MDWTTLGVALAANAVAIAAIVYGYKQHRASLEQQSRLADLESVRDVIDETAAHLHVVATALDNVRLRLTTMGKGFFESKEGDERPEGLEKLRELGRAGDQLDVLLARLSVRLGEGHQAVVKLAEVDKAVLALWRRSTGSGSTWTGKAPTPSTGGGGWRSTSTSSKPRSLSSATSSMQRGPLL